MLDRDRKTSMKFNVPLVPSQLKSGRAGFDLFELVVDYFTNTNPTGLEPIFKYHEYLILPIKPKV